MRYPRWIIIVLLFVIAMGCDSKPSDETTTGQIDKTCRLLIINSLSKYPYTYVGRQCKDCLEDLGYRTGENLIIEEYGIGNDPARGQEILAGLDLHKFDVICVTGTMATIAARDQLYKKTDIPVVFTVVTDPVGLGVIADFQQTPPANFTGVSHPVPVASRFDFIRVLMPNAQTIGLIHSNLSPSLSYGQWIDELLAHDPRFQDIKIISREILYPNDPEQLDIIYEEVALFVAELNDQVDLFISPNDSMGDDSRFAHTVFTHATKPLCGLSSADVMDGRGATFVMFPSYRSMGRQAGHMIHRVLQGESIATILPERPRDNGIAIDMDKANQFGLRVPIDIIEMAGDFVVQSAPSIARRN